jgi:hypothetical protein
MPLPLSAIIAVVIDRPLVAFRPSLIAIPRDSSPSQAGTEDPRTQLDEPSIVGSKAVPP